MKISDRHIIEQRRFDGVTRIYGQRAVENFKNAHVCVIGLGGVGSWAVEALARTAIGQLTLIDLDNVAVSNINRQIYALDETIGLPKTDAAQQRIHSINPRCKVNLIENFIDLKNIDQVMDPGFNYVIDCIDNFRVKSALIAHCKRKKISLLVTGGSGGQTDPQKIKTADLSRSENDPLLAQVRRLLRQEYGFSRNLKRRFDIPCIYSAEQLAYPADNGEITFDKSRSASTSGLNCAQGFGSTVTVTASFGMSAAAYVLKKLAAIK